MNYIQELKKLVEISSYRTDKEGVNHAIENFVQLVFNLPLTMERIPSEYEEFADALYLKSESQENDVDSPRILLTGHIDTVFRDISKFDIRIEDNKLYGPGAVDMKSGLIVIVETLRRLKEKGQLKNIGVLITTDEEAGAPHNTFPQFSEIVADYDIGLVFEPDGSVEKKPINYDVKNLVVSRKGLLVGKLSANAKGGHSGALTEKVRRHSAIHELIYQAGKIKSLTDYETESTTNIGKFDADGEFNILAETAVIEFDARMKTLAEYERLINRFQVLDQDKEDKAVDLRYELSFDAVPVEFTDANKKILRIAQEKVGPKLGVKVEPEHRGGGSDMSRFFYYNRDLAMLDNLGPIGSGEHTVNEFVYLDSLEPNIKFATTLIPILQENF